jgi:hypothetical protein
VYFFPFAAGQYQKSLCTVTNICKFSLPQSVKHTLVMLGVKLASVRRTLSSLQVLNKIEMAFQRLYLLRQGSQTQIDQRATFQRKNSPQAAV